MRAPLARWRIIQNDLEHMIMEDAGTDERPALLLTAALAQQRKEAVEWTLTTAKQLRFHRETIFLSVNLHDRCLQSMLGGKSEGSISEAQHLLIASTQIVWEPTIFSLSPRHLGEPPDSCTRSAC